MLSSPLAYARGAVPKLECFLFRFYADENDRRVVKVNLLAASRTPMPKASVARSLKKI
jgi:hypothetical protein